MTGWWQQLPVTTSQSTPDQLEILLLRLLAGPAVPEPPPKPEPPTALVSGGSGSKACPGRGDWEF